MAESFSSGREGVGQGWRVLGRGLYALHGARMYACIMCLSTPYTCAYRGCSRDMPLRSLDCENVAAACLPASPPPCLLGTGVSTRGAMYIQRPRLSARTPDTARDPETSLPPSAQR